MCEESFLQLITLMFGTKLRTGQPHIAVTIVDGARQFLQAVLFTLCVLTANRHRCRVSNTDFFFLCVFVIRQSALVCLQEVSDCQIATHTYTPGNGGGREGGSKWRYKHFYILTQPETSMSG